MPPTTVSDQIDHEFKYWTFWRRFWAGMLDGVISYPLQLLDLYLTRRLEPGGLAAIWLVISSFLYLVYSVVMHGEYGQTLGKMATGVKVFDLSGAKLSYRQALLRDSGGIVLSVAAVALQIPVALHGSEAATRVPATIAWIIGGGSALWAVAEIVTMLTNRERRALHDFIAGSVVLRLKRRENPDRLY